MIQRKQSVYLLLGAAALAAFFFLDGVLQSQAAESLVWYAPSLMAMGASAAVLAVVSIFLYENRSLQQRLVVSAQVVDLLLIVLLLAGLFLTGTLGQLWQGPGGTERVIALVLPAVAYVFFYLARRGILADIELVRSMDRLR